jgi:hypothetical protein
MIPEFSSVPANGSAGAHHLLASARQFEQAAIERDMFAVIASLSETPGEYYKIPAIEEAGSCLHCPTRQARQKEVSPTIFSLRNRPYSRSPCACCTIVQGDRDRPANPGDSRARVRKIERKR